MIPRITWGASFANTLVLAYALDNPNSYSQDKPGSSHSVGPTSAASWITGTDYFLEGDLRHIATAAAGGISGWDGATGVRAFLEWARDTENLIRWIPDEDTPGTYITARLVGPKSGPMGLEKSFRRSVRILIQSTDGSDFDGY